MGDFITDYIKSIENPDRIGWNGKVWGAPTLKGYDTNQRGYGIDIRYNNAAKNLVKNRKGLWLTDKEVTDLMNLHLLYVTGVAKRKIKGFNTFSPKKQAAILGMLYRGDSVQSNVNVNEPNDTKFLNAVHTYYKNKGLNQRMLNSINFFSKYLKGGLIRKMQTAAGGPLTLPGKSQKEVNETNNYNKNKAKGLFKGIISGKILPTMSNIGSMLGAAYNGWLDPETTTITGEPTILPSRGINTKTILNVAKGVRTLEDYLKTTKVTAQALEGSSAARSAYATDRYLGGVMFENSLPEAASQIQGHGMAKASTLLENLARLRYILDNGLEKGKTFFTAPLKVSDARIGSALGTGGGKPYFDGHFLITGKPGLMINSVDDIGTIYINDAYQNEEALKAALKLQKYLLLTYPKINFKLYSLGFKKGGKMNVIEQFKKGYKIKIKESQKGSFTKYCNGKVTNECIQRGKNSPDPKIRKKATFALNSRRWKHLSGGQLIKAQEGTKFLSKQWFQNTGLKVNNFLSSDFGKFAINAGQQIYNNISSGVKLAETKDRLQKWKQAYINSIEPKDFSLQVAEEERQIKLANPDYNISPIVSAYKENILATQAANKAKQKASQEADLIIMLLLLNLNELSSSTGRGFGSLLTGGLEMLGLLGSKKSNTGTNTGTTNLSTYKWTLNGSPSTYTPSQNTSNVYTGFNLTTPVLTAPTIPIKYNNFTL